MPVPGSQLSGPLLQVLRTFGAGLVKSGMLKPLGAAAREVSEMPGLIGVRQAAPAVRPSQLPETLRGLVGQAKPNLLRPGFREIVEAAAQRRAASLPETAAPGIRGLSPLITNRTPVQGPVTPPLGPVVTRVGEEIRVRPGGIPLQAPTPGVRPPAPEAPGTTFRQTSLFSPADNEALQAFYQRGGLPRDISYKSKAGLRGLEPEAQLGARAFVEGPEGRLIPSSSRIFPGEVEGQLPLNIYTQIASRLSDAPRNRLSGAVQNLADFLKSPAGVATSLGAAGIGTGALAYELLRGREAASPEASLQTPMGPATESVDAGGVVNDPQAARNRQANLAQQIAAGMSPGARANMPAPTYRGADGQTVIVQRGEDEALTAAKQQYARPENALAAEYSRRRQFAEDPRNKAQIISQLVQRGVLDTPDLVAWAGQNPALAYDLLRKAGGGTLPSQQVPQPVQKVITAPAGSNTANNMIGNTAATAEATLGGSQGASDLRGFTSPQLADEFQRLDPALIYALQGVNLI